MRTSVNGQRSLAPSPGLAKSRHSGAELPQARLIRIGGLCHAAEFAKRHRATDIRKKARTQWLTTGSLPAQSCKKREGINRETGELIPRAPTQHANQTGSRSFPMLSGTGKPTEPIGLWSNRGARIGPVLLGNFPVQDVNLADRSPIASCIG